MRTGRIPPGLGRWGMEEFVEPYVRRLVAERLGVGLDQLVSSIALRDDLAADSLDLVELAVALEGEFAIVVPERILDQVRTYSELVHATGLLIGARRAAEARGAEPPARIWARIVPAMGESASTLERTGWLTPYAAETIAEDALRAGSGARLEVTVAAGTAASVARVQHQFARLRKRGVQVTVRSDDRPPPPHSTADRVTERRPVVAAGGHSSLTDRLLDQLIGARTTVTVTGYAGDDPWQADDLIACVGEGAKRFGDGTPSEQAQAMSGSGPCQFMEGVPTGRGYRATARGHHVHADFDRASDRAVGPPRDIIEKEPTRLEIGLGFAKNARYYQSAVCTTPGQTTWRGAAYYSRDLEGRAFDIGGSMTRLTPSGHPSGRQHGLRAQFDVSAASRNDFRLLRATLDCAAEDGACALVIHVSARVAGEDLFGRVRLGGGIGTTMDVRLLPPTRVLEVDGAASP